MNKKITKDVSYMKLQDLNNYVIQENALVEINNGFADEVLIDVNDSH